MVAYIYRNPFHLHVRTFVKPRFHSLTRSVDDMASSDPILCVKANTVVVVFIRDLRKWSVRMVEVLLPCINITPQSSMDCVHLSTRWTRVINLTPWPILHADSGGGTGTTAKRKISASTGSRTFVGKPVSGHCTDWLFLVHTVTVFSSFVPKVCS
jgi:hypothetical protein